MRHSKQIQAQPCCPLLLGLVIAVLVMPPWAQQTWASSPELRMVGISGCNAQEVLDGAATIYWTSSFSDGEYPFVESMRRGSIVSGSGPTLEVTVQWSVVGTSSSMGTGIGFRGAGFSPEGTKGHFVVPSKPEPTVEIEDPSECGVDVSAASYGSLTFWFTFTELHKPGGRIVAKGNAALIVFVDIEGEGVKLGTNLHVATGPDPQD